MLDLQRLVNELIRRQKMIHLFFKEKCQTFSESSFFNVNIIKAQINGEKQYWQ